MNDQKIEQIIQDLFAADPSFRAMEDEIRRIIRNLAAERPDVAIDEEFILTLRSRLQKEIQSMPVKAPAAPFFLAWSFKRFALAGSALVLLVLFGAGMLGVMKGRDGGSGPAVSQAPIIQLKERAFDSLAALSRESAEGRGGGGDSLIPSSAPLAAPSPLLEARLVEGSGVSAMPIQAVNYSFVYKGGEFSVSDGKLPVFKKAERGITIPFAGVLSAFNINSVDLAKFGGAGIESITVKEDRDFGYIATLQLNNGSLYISKNWEKWPQPSGGGACRGEICIMGSGVESETKALLYPYPYDPIPISEMPGDEEIIAIADNFLNEYGINLAGYGKPEVQHYNYYGETSQYAPEEISVTYPIVLEGKAVVDWSGNPRGASLSVDIRQKKVSSASFELALAYESSLYEVETDVERILEIIKSRFPYYYYPDQGQTLEIPLGTPSLGLTAEWKYDNVLGQSYELYIPAMMFPILEVPEGAGYFYQKSVVIPLIKEAMEQVNDLPVPLSKPILLPKPLDAVPEREPGF